ncbi:probable mediator of RNA polymerase II transcription subunit 26c isoform X1 [Camellia sinensis]|uniref:probable mediator of RNA polymerase II transcription subunit 26c isoform X1 n=1 Tax=Camellia sinensis TaxID=4442 RepID=UPI001036D57D|nr:probable mediator of RNA polymerase II transcription subunit 26c isoform X1 [Camellia sinensis]
MDRGFREREREGKLRRDLKFGVSIGLDWIGSIRVWRMDLDAFRMILSNSRVNVWELIDTAITVASLDYGHELKDRRDRIVERLYTTTSSDLRCQNCDVDLQRPNGVPKNEALSLDFIKEERSHDDEHEQQQQQKEGGSPSTPQSIHRDADDDDDNEERDPYGGLFDDEETRILNIKEQLEDPDQSEDSLVELLQSLADMDITFKALKETDIGRHVNRLRKNPSNDVRRLVKQLVRKWKDLVDEWVKLNTPNQLVSSSLIVGVLAADGDSPQQNVPPSNTRNGLHHQVPDFAYSPNPHNGSSGSDKNNSEPEPKAKVVPRRDAPAAKPTHSIPLAASAPPPKRQQKESSLDLERLASTRKRLHENYQEAENARKQRTIQVMDIHEIPKPKNTFFAKNKGGPHGRHR